MIKRKTSLLAVGGLVLVLLLLVVAFSGCLNSEAGAAEGDTVFVHYVGTFENGTVFDSGNLPPFVLGQGHLISGFQNAIYGMKVGETKRVTLPPEEAYGQYDPSNVTIVSREMIESIGFTPEVGTVLPTTFGPRPIIAVDGDNVTIDLNHPLAGYTLIFEITLVDIVRG